jgi:hypothetical protein
MENIIENNKLIAKFIGSEFMQSEIVPMLGHHYPTNEELNFDSDWNWLMPVVEKIESLYDGKAFVVQIRSTVCDIFQNTQHWKAFQRTINLPTLYTSDKTKIEAVYQAVILFIKWYNQNK